jgi:hypothetical protein
MRARWLGRRFFAFFYIAWFLACAGYLTDWLMPASAKSTSTGYDKTKQLWLANVNKAAPDVQAKLYHWKTP